jgi:2,3-diaminopropionate biosynthesis protein SbnB
MNSNITAPPFAVVTGHAVQRVLAGREQEVVDLVEAAYRLHGEGQTVNPPSYFLRFPDRPEARIIALPASVGGAVNTAGLKWVASFPRNVEHGLPRASATLVLNDKDTGYPFACLESSIISATRTAASAALAALALGRDRASRGSVGFFGTGLIGRYLHDYLAAVGWPIERIGVYDAMPDRASAFGAYVAGRHPRLPVKVHDSPQGLVGSSDVLVFATTAGTPHVTDPAWFEHGPLVLHVSLRDLGTDVISRSINVVDDVEHCLKADTSVHLTEKRTGGREFLHATLYDVLAGRFAPPAGGTVVFSPFGLGVLDVVLGEFVHRECRRSGDIVEIEGFFSDLSTFPADDAAPAATEGQ